MGRTVDLDDLASAGVVAARLGLRRIQALHTWMERDPTCPRPIAYFSRTAIWYWPDVREWALDNGWQPVGQRPTAKRILIEPTDMVPADLIVARLDLNPVELGLKPDTKGRYRWGPAESYRNRPPTGA